MAGIIKRPNRKCWVAVIRVNSKEKRKSTNIPVNPTPADGYTAKQAEKKAREIAEKLEQAERGETGAAAALRALADKLDGGRFGKPRTTVQDFFAKIQPTGIDKTQRSYNAAYAEFLRWLGDDTAAPIDSITTERCMQYLGYLFNTGLASGTVSLQRRILSAAFNRAVRDDILSKNPWTLARMDEAHRRFIPEQKGAIRTKRLPFTVDEMQVILTQFPHPWQDVAAVSFYTNGQRLGDCCKLTWEQVDMRRGVIHIVTKKTGKKLELPIHEALRERLETLAPPAARSGYLFPTLGKEYEKNETSTLSGDFVALLRSFNIVPPADDSPTAGRRHNVSPKSFHSIRHTVSSLLAADPSIPEELAMQGVGHDDKEVHSGYVTASTAELKRLPDALHRAITARR